MTYGLPLFLYGITSLLLWQTVRISPKAALKLKVLVTVLTAIALTLHLLELYPTLATINDQKLSLIQSLAMVSAGIVLFYLTSLLSVGLFSLGGLLLPIAFTTLLPSAFITATIHTDSALMTNLFADATWHTLLGIAVIACFTLACAQALLVILQDRQLRQHQPLKQKSAFMSQLPPLLKMERLLFKFITVSFLLLSLNLILGVWIQYNRTGYGLSFTHHTLLLCFAWLGFAVLLIGRMKYGWRGQAAAKYYLVGFFVFLLGSIGPLFVREYLLS